MPSDNKHMLNSKITDYGFNCNSRDEWPLKNEYLTPRIVYRADVTNNKADEHKYYYGISDTPFKDTPFTIWNRKTLAQNEYHIYRQIPLHTHDYLTN